MRSTSDGVIVFALTIKWLQKLMNRIVYYIYPDFQPFWFSFLSDIPSLLLLHLTCLESFFSHSLRVCLLVINSLNFFLCLYFLFISGGYFPRYRTCCQQFFFISALENVVLPSGLHGFRWKKLPAIIRTGVSPIGICVVSLWLLLRFFSLSFIYRSLIMMCLGMDLLALTLVGVFSAFWNCIFLSFCQLRSFQPFFFSEHFFLALHFFLLSFWDYSDTNVRPSVNVLKISETLFIFLNLFFPVQIE